MSFDSFGSSPLGERKESPLGVFGKGLIGELIHMGYVGVAIDVATPPVPCGQNIFMAGHIKDPTAPFYMRVEFISVTVGNLLRIFKQSPTGASADYTATTTSTVSAAAGLAAACAASADSFFLRVSWTSTGSILYGKGKDSGTDLNFLDFSSAVKFQSIALVGDWVMAFLTMSDDLSSVLSVKRLPWAGGQIVGFKYNSYHYSANTLVAACTSVGGTLGLLEYDGVSVQRRNSSTIVGFISKGLNYVYLGTNSIREAVIITGAQVGSRYSYSGINAFSSFAYDGTNYYLAASRSTGSRIVLLKLDATFSVVQCYDYQTDIGILYTHGANLSVTNGTVVMYLTAGNHDPVWIGVQASDISVVMWALSSRKHEDIATITSNDTATTYTVNIGAQSVSVPGNATSANATASDLRDACDASALSSFVNRTWTLNGAEVKGIYNFSGASGTGSIGGSVVGGAGTISVSSLDFAPKFLPAKAPVNDGTYIYYGGKRKINTTDFAYAARKIDAATGAEVLTMTCDEQLTGNNELSGVHLSGNELLFSGLYYDTPAPPAPLLRFGTNDIVAMKLPIYTDNMDVQQDTVGMVLTDVTSSIVRSAQASFSDTFESNLLIDDAPTISVDDLQLTF